MTFDKDLAMKRFKENIVTWDRLINYAKGHEKDRVVIKLPEPIKHECAKPGTDEVINVEFPCISFVNLPSGQTLPVLVRIDENGHTAFGVSEENMKMFIEERHDEKKKK